MPPPIMRRMRRPLRWFCGFGLIYARPNIGNIR
jgi:hypothetical protein